jgi:hypothetical protein
MGREIISLLKSIDCSLLNKDKGVSDSVENVFKNKKQNEKKKINDEKKER